MALRYLHIVLPEDVESDPGKLLADHDIVASWRDPTLDRGVALYVVVDAAKAEPVMDALEQRYAGTEGFHAVLMSVDAVLPRPDPEQADPPERPAIRPGRRAWLGTRVSREELYSSVSEGMQGGGVFLALTVLSAVVAALGLLRDSSTIVIAAMVIAPLLGPNIALAFATTIGDTKMLGRALRTNIIGLALALALSITLGALVEVDPATGAIASRTTVDLIDVVLALASGIAGALAITTGQGTTVLGVMVAVALMPPAVVLGLLVGSGRIEPAMEALLLLVTNIVCVNLAAVATFIVQGVHPRTWFESERARRSTRRAVALWTILLAALVVLLWLR